MLTVQLNGELAKESKPLIAEAIGNRVVNVAFGQPGKETVRLSDRSCPTSRG